MVLFSEDHIQETKRRGRIEVICGSMFSGKTEELIRRLKRAKFAKQRVEIFKPAIDTRYSEADVVSHDSHSIASTPIDSSASILLFTSEIDVVGIDEAQFFDSGLIDVCNQLANNGIRVIVAGLDMDFRGIPFGPMPGLCAIADEVSKVHAICVKCGQLASFSHRTVKNDKQVLLGKPKNMNRYAESAISKPSKPTKRKSVINKYKKQSIMERKKITFDSFIRGVILGVIIIGILMLFQASKRRIAAILHRMAHCLSDIPPGHLLPVQIKAQEPGHIHLLRLIQYSDCRRNRLLSACASHDGRIRQGKRFGNRLLFQRNPRRQCAQNTL